MAKKGANPLKAAHLQKKAQAAALGKLTGTGYLELQCMKIIITYVN